MITLTTPQLWKLQRKFENPTNLAQKLVLAGVQSELQAREEHDNEDWFNGESTTETRAHAGGEFTPTADTSASVETIIQEALSE